jgi:hypothetical protein
LYKEVPERGKVHSGHGLARNADAKRASRSQKATHGQGVGRRGATQRFSDYFESIEKVEAAREIFGEKTDEVLHNLYVQFTWIGGYMWVNGADGRLMISSNYLNHGDKVDIYLDLIHELVHVKQFMDRRELFDVHYSYTARPTEVEACRAAVQEARRLGLSDERICEYLKTEWMSTEDLKQLAKTLNVNCQN